MATLSTTTAIIAVFDSQCRRDERGMRPKLGLFTGSDLVILRKTSCNIDGDRLTAVERRPSLGHHHIERGRRLLDAAADSLH